MKLGGRGGGEEREAGAPGRHVDLELCLVSKMAVIAVTF